MRDEQLHSRLTQRERELGKRLAEQLHRAIATEHAARQAADDEAKGRYSVYMEGGPLPPTNIAKLSEHLRSCEVRTGQARHELNAHAAAIGKRLAVHYFASISDHFRAIAAPVEPIPFDQPDIDPRTASQAIRKNAYRQQHDAQIAYRDIQFLMYRDGLSYTEAETLYRATLANKPDEFTP